MRIVQVKSLISKGAFAQSKEFETLLSDVKAAITSVAWPPESTSFSLKPIPKGNGVKPIKDNCMAHLAAKGWVLEKRLALGSRINPGPVDAVLPLENGKLFAVEWETGNISSSHRAINKIAIGLLNKTLCGGILVLPSRKMYKFLTDRVGNYCEIEPYFPVWEKLEMDEGYLGVIEIEHDEESNDAPLIPKGTDGWALHQQDS